MRQALGGEHWGPYANRPRQKIGPHRRPQVVLRIPGIRVGGLVCSHTEAVQRGPD